MRGALTGWNSSIIPEPISIPPLEPSGHLLANDIY